MGAGSSFAVTAVVDVGVSGRTTIAGLIWVVAWTVLHSRWKDRQVESRRVHFVTMLLIGMGVLLTCPPVWTLR